MAAAFKQYLGAKIMDAMTLVSAAQLTENEVFRVGDTVCVHYKIMEGKVERIQNYEGIVIALNNGGISRTLTVRKISHGVGVERIFPLHSPKIDSIDVIRRGKVRKAKLYYLRNRIGKAAMKVKEKINQKK